MVVIASTCMFVAVICALTVIVAVLFAVAKRCSPDNEKLQEHVTDKNHLTLRRQYLTVYCLACFADWLQGPYAYQLYRSYGLDDGEIAVLFIAYTASNSVFGTLTGALADAYGRRILCVAYGVLYSACCVTKLYDNYEILMVGCVLGGMSTSILYTAFDSWYTNEHINHYKLPGEWVSDTFAKAATMYAALAILAGLTSYLMVGQLRLGLGAPFVAAVPFLAHTSAYATMSLTEHYAPDAAAAGGTSAVLASIRNALVLSVTDKQIFSLNVVQSLYDGVIYLFAFVWTPALESLKPPLGLLFASFMLALMVGSIIYAIMVGNGATHSNVPLQLSTFLAFLAFIACSLTVFVTSSSYAVETCYFCFLLYEVSVGMYIPSMAYSKSRAIPENVRVTTCNVLKIPKHVFTCSALFWIRLNRNNGVEIISTLYAVSSIATFVTFVSAVTFSKFQSAAARRRPLDKIEKPQAADSSTRI